MKYGILETPTLKANECLVLGLFSDAALPDYAQKLDQRHNQLISRLFAKLTEAGDSLWQADIEGHSLLLVHCGKQSKFDSRNLRKRLTEVIAALLKQRISTVSLCLPAISDHEANWQLEQMLLQVDAQLYQFSEFKTKNKQPTKLESVHFYLPQADKTLIKTAQTIGEGLRFTRHLADLPANICTPSYLAAQAFLLTEEYDSLSAEILGPEEIRKLGMGALLAVAQGSVQEPRFIEMLYDGGGDTAPIVLVGKGITFDSGGLSLKPANMMDEMKYDMAGAASVLGTLKICAALKLPVNVIGLIASAENMPSGSAVKPGDIITTMSGQTVEVLNTDAEGRLVLADALTYAERFQPQLVLDLATLTGAMVVALGSVATGFMTADDELAEQLLAAAKESGDKSWRLPLDEDYQEAMDSPIADMINAAFDRSAGAITAACFLSRFTKKYRWAHLDIAGTAWVSGKKRAATGRPVPLLIQFLRHVANSR